MYMYTYQKWNVIVDGMNFIKNEFLQHLQSIMHK